MINNQIKRADEQVERAYDHQNKTNEELEKFNEYIEYIIEVIIDLDARSEILYEELERLEEKLEKEKSGRI